ncbi:MAG: ABC transporter substrate-binding protein [Reyranellaceae bacterium]
MKRRGLLLASLAALPATVRAQARSGLPRVGFLFPGSAEPIFGRMRGELRRLGYVEGRTIAFEVRAAAGQSQRLPALAAELVGLPVDVIVATQTPAVYAARAATTSIPIVMSSGAPVRTGLVASLARPGGNITGMSGTSDELGAKLLSLVREAFPGADRVGVLANADDPFTAPFLELLEHAQRPTGVTLIVERVSAADDYAGAFAAFERQGARAVIVQPSLRRGHAIALATARRLPSASPWEAFAAEGGLLAYAANRRAVERRLVQYIDRVLKGAKPADLPVELPTEYALVVNVRAARAIGIEIPMSVLVRADDLIE